MGLLKNAHLRCCAANRTAQRMLTIRLAVRFLRALHLNIPYQVRDKLLNSPQICMKKSVIAGLDPAIQDYMY